MWAGKGKPRVSLQPSMEAGQARAGSILGVALACVAVGSKNEKRALCSAKWQAKVGDLSTGQFHQRY